MEPRNRFQGMNSASLCSLAGRYDNPIPTRFLAPLDCLKIPALCNTNKSVETGEQIFDTLHITFIWLSICGTRFLILLALLWGKTYGNWSLFSSFQVLKTVVNHTKLHEILISNMAAPTIQICFQIQKLLTILPTREDILPQWIWVRCKTQLDNMSCGNFFEGGLVTPLLARSRILTASRFATEEYSPILYSSKEWA